MIRDVVSQMGEFLEQEAEPDLDTIQRWHDQLVEKLDSVRVEEKTNPGDPDPYYQGSVSGDSIELAGGLLEHTSEHGTWEVTVETLELDGLELLALAEKGRELLATRASGGTVGIDTGSL